MTLKYPKPTLDVYFHMRNHYRKLRNVQSRVRAVNSNVSAKGFEFVSEPYDKDIDGNVNAKIKAVRCSSTERSSLRSQDGNGSVRSAARQTPKRSSSVPRRPPTRRNPVDMPSPRLPKSARERSTSRQSGSEDNNPLSNDNPQQLKSISKPTAKDGNRTKNSKTEKCDKKSKLVDRATVGPSSCCTPCYSSRCPTCPTSFIVSKGVVEHEYLQFALRITEDIIRNDLYTNKEMQRVFNSHIEANRGRLDMTKMLEQIDTLSKELNINGQRFEDVLPQCVVLVNDGPIDLEESTPMDHAVRRTSDQQPKAADDEEDDVVVAQPEASIYHQVVRNFIKVPSLERLTEVSESMLSTNISKESVCTPCYDTYSIVSTAVADVENCDGNDAVTKDSSQEIDDSIRSMEPFNDSQESLKQLSDFAVAVPEPDKCVKMGDGDVIRHTKTDPPKQITLLLQISDKPDTDSHNDPNAKTICINYQSVINVCMAPEIIKDLKRPSDSNVSLSENNFVDDPPAAPTPRNDVPTGGSSKRKSPRAMPKQPKASPNPVQVAQDNLRMMSMQRIADRRSNMFLRNASIESAVTAVFNDDERATKDPEPFPAKRPDHRRRPTMNDNPSTKRRVTTADVFGTVDDYTVETNSSEPYENDDVPTKTQRIMYCDNARLVDGMDRRRPIKDPPMCTNNRDALQRPDNVVLCENLPSDPDGTISIQTSFNMDDYQTAYAAATKVDMCSCMKPERDKSLSKTIDVVYRSAFDETYENAPRAKRSETSKQSDRVQNLLLDDKYELPSFYNAKDFFYPSRQTQTTSEDFEEALECLEPSGDGEESSTKLTEEEEEEEEEEDVDEEDDELEESEAEQEQDEDSLERGANKVARASRMRSTSLQSYDFLDKLDYVPLFDTTPSLDKTVQSAIERTERFRIPDASLQQQQISFHLLPSAAFDRTPVTTDEDTEPTLVENGDDANGEEKKKLCFLKRFTTRKAKRRASLGDAVKDDFVEIAKVSSSEKR